MSVSQERLDKIAKMREEDIARMNANNAKSGSERGPVPTAEDHMIVIRAERDRRIAETDWTQLPDVSDAIKSKWQGYRQALRDVPQNNTCWISIILGNISY